MIYIIDILLIFRTTFFSPDTGDEIWSLKHIAIRYMKKGMILDIISSLTVLPTIIPGTFSVDTETFFSFCGLLKTLRIQRFNSLVSGSNLTRGNKTILKLIIVFIFIMIFLHLVSCLNWFYLTKGEWVAPKDFGYLDLDYVYNQRNASFWENYLLMQYHSAFVFNMIDIAPISGRNVLLAIVLLLSAAIVNAQIFGIFFGHIEDLKQPEKNLNESLDMVRNSNFRLGLPSELSEGNVSQVLRTNQYKTL